MHANSAREAVIKLCTLPLLAGENVTDRSWCRPWRRCIDLVVQIGVEPDGSPAGPRDRRPAGPGRGWRRGDRGHLHLARTANSFARRASRRIRTASRSTASTWRTCWRCTGPPNPQLPKVNDLRRLPSEGWITPDSRPGPDPARDWPSSPAPRMLSTAASASTVVAGVDKNCPRFGPIRSVSRRQICSS